MNSRTVLLILFFFVGFSFQNCTKNNILDCSFPPAPDFFDIQSMVVNHVGLDKRTIESDIIDFEDYGFLSFSFFVEYLSFQKPETWNFSLMNGVYGCSPPEAGTLGSKEESFIDIQFLTLNVFDEEHGAGTSINDLLEITNLERDPVPLNYFLMTYKNNVPTEWYLLKLKKRPTMNQDFQFKVIVDLSNGEQYEEISKVVRFQ